VAHTPNTIRATNTTRASSTIQEMTCRELMKLSNHLESKVNIWIKDGKVISSSDFANALLDWSESAPEALGSKAKNKKPRMF